MFTIEMFEPETKKWHAHRERFGSREEAEKVMVSSELIQLIKLLSGNRAKFRVAEVAPEPANLI